MQTLCIIPSGKPKIWDRTPGAGPVPAHDAYVGTLHSLCQKYARTHFEQWIILSPKYGFLLPGELVPSTYDLSFSRRGDQEYTISIEELNAQATEKYLDAFPEIVMLGGKKFKPIIETCFPTAVHFHYPLFGTRGIGDMQAMLKDALLNNEKLHE
ncbi:DUF6884 domain-containing protein [Falsibacillus albus]|uniref:DUF6884 domain-containing protein n=1 Tax=Falsibacillus albus TaxID=2478915 RepID=A0A3L7K0A1_9BACI|nr:DUF6884 domain-containing protein [Falsibacillus albus]RLQ95381.1 hypothetical protein D9X91_10090 [Falsibacillus albus]